MKRTLIKEIRKGLQAFDGKQVSVSGWVRSARDFNNVGFIDLNDGTTSEEPNSVYLDLLRIK